jgi:hypothetical protein
VEGVQSILRGEWSACETCAHHVAMNVLIDQFRNRRPQWWVVDGAVVVPIWIVESLKKNRELEI